MPFGKRLKEARLSRGMTQQQLASAVGVTKGAIGNYESEVSSPKEQILIKLMDVLSVDANFLFQDMVSRSSSHLYEKKEPASPGGLTDSVMRLYDEAADLSPEEADTVRAFVLGLKANRKP